ncbi:MAG: Smr/MutS family protein [Bacteroidales bacterium]|nr:Smr/MutS family protein [Bacteroidales bacterium]
MIYPKNFENKIGFDKIREMLKAYCLGDLGKERVERFTFSNDFEQINTFINQVNEFKIILLDRDDFPSDNYIDVTKYLEKAKVQGIFLEQKELFDLRRSLLIIKAILKFFKNDDENKYPYLKKLTKDINIYPYIIDSIDKIINNHGKVKNNASPELASIRRELLNTQSNISKQMVRILKNAQAQSLVDDSVSLTVRDGRAVIPIKSANKRKVPGIVHDESSTGKTSFIEPAEIVELNNKIKELEYAERREIIKILIEFTDSIRPYLAELFFAYDFLGIIDFIRAKAVFAIQTEAVLPTFCNEQLIDLIQARHPLLYLSFKKDKKKVVPLDIYLSEEQRIILISGPNAGGKSVCLKTVGLIQYMLQCGMLIPVDEKSKIGLFNNIFIDIGDEQSIENDLSTYSSHLINMKYFTKKADVKSLILIDEFGTGTEPMLGGAIAEAVLKKLNEQQTYGVLTTHYTNLKHFAASADGIANGAMLFDNNKLEPLFKLEIGKPGSSFAFEIARKIGLSEEILNSAKDKIGTKHISFDKHLKDIARDKNYWENKRKKIRKSEKKLEELIQKQEEELNQSIEIKKKIISKANIEAEQLLTKSNKIIENTIRVIKESNAEKERTKQVRTELESYKDKVKHRENEKDEVIANKINNLTKIKKRIKIADSELKIESKDEPINIGDNVKLIGQNDVVGEVIEFNQNNYMVAFGNMITQVEKKKLERIGKNEFKRINKQKGFTTSNYNEEYNKRKFNFKLGLDVRGKRVDEAIPTVMQYIDEAIMLNVKEVKILHGKGNGILRQLIREYLHTVDLIKSYKDEHIEFGGAGITVVCFE